MTKEQAKEILRCNTDLGHGVIIENESTESIYEALDMAIKALEQPTSDDCVSREAVVEWLERATDDSIEHAIDSNLEFITPVTPTQRWIPVSERLPDGMGTYLVTLEYKEHGKGITTLWYHGKTIGWDLCVADVVTAWQPLPEPYKGDCIPREYDLSEDMELSNPQMHR